MIDLDVYFGEMFFLVGESGGGKTTLLSAIAGILDFDAGESDRPGNPAASMSAGRRTRFQPDNGVHLSAVQPATGPHGGGECGGAAAHSRTRATSGDCPRPHDARVMGLGTALEALETSAANTASRHRPARWSRNPVPRLRRADGGARRPQCGKIMEIIREVGRAPDRCVIVVTHDSRVFHFGDRMAELTDGRIVGVHPISKEAST
ncbi:MAG: ATP-binding cassette domain-containing protein [Nitrospiraceae bacterium]